MKLINIENNKPMTVSWQNNEHDQQWQTNEHNQTWQINDLLMSNWWQYANNIMNINKHDKFIELITY